MPTAAQNRADAHDIPLSQAPCGLCAGSGGLLADQLVPFQVSTSGAGDAVAGLVLPAATQWVAEEHQISDRV